MKDQLFEIIEMSLGEKPFNAQKTAEYLESENPLVILAALELLKKRYHEAMAGSLLTLVFHPDPKIAAGASEVLHSDPFFAFERREGARMLSGAAAATAPEGSGRVFLETLFSEERRRELSSALPPVAESDFSRGLAAFAALPGSENLDLDVVFSGHRRPPREHFDRHRRDYLQKRYPPQVSIAPSYRCNLDCSYCYANNLLSLYPRDMDLETFKKMLDILREEDQTVKRVGLIGGEPLNFPGLTSFAQELQQRGLDFYFASNGVIEPGLFRDVLRFPNLLGATVHIEKDPFYTPVQLEKLLTNIRALGEEKTSTIIRYNMQDPRFNGWDFLSKYMEFLPEFIFSFAVVFPSQSGQVHPVRLEQLKDFSGKILSLLKFLKEESGHANVKAVFSKPFPPCAFTPEQFTYVLSHARYKNVCEIDRNGFTNNTCVNPDLSSYPCMALTHPRYRTDRVLPMAELREQNKQTAGFLIKEPLMEECRGCRLFSLGVCQPACYAYVE